MRNLFDDLYDYWFDGIEYLFTENVISFYTFIYTVFAEIAFLWAFGFKTALPFTIILIAAVLNIVVSAFLKMAVECTKPELYVARAYAIAFVVIFVIGLFVNVLTNIVLFAIPLVITWLFVQMREFQITSYLGKFPKIIMIISKIFHNKVFWVTSQIVVVVLPVGLLISFLCLTSLPIVLKIIVSILSVLLIPLLVSYEDATASQTIFEMAYDVTWSEEYEKFSKQIDEKMKIDIEGTTKELVERLEKIEEEYEKLLQKAKEDNEDI